MGALGAVRDELSDSLSLILYFMNPLLLVANERFWLFFFKKCSNQFTYKYIDYAWRSWSRSDHPRYLQASASRDLVVFCYTVHLVAARRYWLKQWRRKGKSLFFIFFFVFVIMWLCFFIEYSCCNFISVRGPELLNKVLIATLLQRCSRSRFEARKAKF